MSDFFWRDAFRLVLPSMPEAVMFVAGLLVTIAFRRRLGAAASTAVIGFAFLALASLAGAAWQLWSLSRSGYGFPMTEASPNVSPAGLELTRAMQMPVDIALLVLDLVGLIYVTAAVFVVRSSHPTPVGRSR
ncbi:hypothetical protein [Micromonospora chersina]|uniref:hypothetical protein n=1 Tax=Micromonospora chersina TaxID=47854 RepID=UPI003720E786